MHRYRSIIKESPSAQFAKIHFSRTVEHKPQRENDVTRYERPSRQPASGGRHGRHLESMTSYQKFDSVSRGVFARETITPNFTPIRFETTECSAVLKKVPPTTEEEEQEQKDD